MLEEEIPEPKPLVEYAFIEDEEEKEEIAYRDRMEKMKSSIKFPFSDFGQMGKKMMNEEIKREIEKFHVRKEPEKIFIPYDIDKQNDRRLIGPPIPKELRDESNIKQDNDEVSITSKLIAKSQIKDEDSDNEDIEEDNENDDLINKIPISHVVELKHTLLKTVNCVDIDRAGIRLLTGCSDGTVKIWDFTGMTRKPEPFQTVDCGDGYPVVQAIWSPTGGFFLSCTGDCQGRIYDRDGNFEIECLKGDNYLHDISNTKGHTYPLTDGKWHPMDKSMFITSSRDSTIRIWDLNSKPVGIDQELMQTTILKAKTFKNHKITIGSCAYSSDGNVNLINLDYCWWSK
jgi:WD repeat-containing protein 70